MKKIFYYLVLTILLIKIGYNFAENSKYWQVAFDYNKVSQLYQHSQFAPNPYDRQLVLQDWDLYPFAGTYYLKTGDLTTINVEHPPLGKYLFGLVNLITKRPLYVQVVVYLLFLYLTYQIANILTQNKILALLTVLGISFEPIITEQLRYCLLDLMVSSSILGFVLIYLKNFKRLKTSKVQIALGILLGITATVKFPAIAILLFGSYFLSILLANNWPAIKKSWLLAVVAITFYLFCYFPLFIHSGIQDFIATHLKAIHIHLSHVPEYPPFSPLRTMLLNQWLVWFDNTNPIHTVSQWNLMWPIFVFTILLMFVFFILKYRELVKKPVLLPWLFLLIYFGFINSRLFFPGYLIPALPFMYLALALLIKSACTKYSP